MDKADGARGGRKLEMVQETLQQFMEERKLNDANGNGEREMEQDLLTSRLLCKLDSVKSTTESNESALTSPVKEQDMCSEHSNSEHKKEEVTDLKKIEKDIKIIKRQNRITHYLLSALIVVTMAWHCGEVSVILAVKDKFTHPVRSIGDMIKGALTGNGKKPLIEGVSLPPIGATEMPNGTLPLVTLTDQE